MMIFLKRKPAPPAVDIEAAAMEIDRLQSLSKAETQTLARLANEARAAAGKLLEDDPMVQVLRDHEQKALAAAESAAAVTRRLRPCAEVVAFSCLGAKLKQNLDAMPSAIAAERKSREGNQKTLSEQARAAAGQAQKAREAAAGTARKVEELQSELARERGGAEDAVRVAQQALDAGVAAADEVAINAAADELAQAKDRLRKVNEGALPLRVESFEKIHGEAMAVAERHERQAQSAERAAKHARAAVAACDLDSAELARLPVLLEYGANAEPHLLEDMNPKWLTVENPCPHPTAPIAGALYLVERGLRAMHEYASAPMPALSELTEAQAWESGRTTAASLWELVSPHLSPVYTFAEHE